MRASRPLRRGAAQRLSRIDGILEAAYGSPEAELGNKDVPLDEAIYIILSFQTDLPRVRATWTALRAEFPSWEAVERAPTPTIAAVLREGGLHRQKARTIQRLLSEVRARILRTPSRSRGSASGLARDPSRAATLSRCASAADPLSRKPSKPTRRAHPAHAKLVPGSDILSDP